MKDLSEQQMQTGMLSPKKVTKSLYEAPMSDEEYAAWFKEFVEGWRCRICKTPLTMDNFGGVGENHMIFCKDCKYEPPKVSMYESVK